MEMENLEQKTSQPREEELGRKIISCDEIGKNLSI